MAAVETLLMIGGGLDLSVASVAVLAGQACAVALEHGWSTPAAIAAMLAMGAGAGAVNATFAVGFGINPLVTTLGTQFVFRGVAQAWTNGVPIGIENHVVLDIGSATWVGIPEATVAMAAFFVAVFVVLRYTRYGSNLYAIGSSARAARRAGIAVRRNQTIAYILTGVTAAVAGLVLIGFQGSSVPFSAIGVELTVLAAVVLGGTGLAGGTGSVFGTLLGVVLLAVVASGLLELSLPSYWQLIVTGVVLAAAVTIDDVQRRRRETRG
jgi:ribose transport system permease protein